MASLVLSSPNSLAGGNIALEKRYCDTALQKVFSIIPVLEAGCQSGSLTEVASGALKDVKISMSQLQLSLQPMVTAVKAKYDETSKLLDQKVAKRKALEDSLQEHKSTYAKLVADIANLTSQVHNNEQSIKDLEVEITLINSEMKKLDNLISSLSQEIRELGIKIVNQQRTADLYARNISAHESELVTLRSNQKSLEDDLRNAKASVLTEERKLAEAERQKRDFDDSFKGRWASAGSSVLGIFGDGNVAQREFESWQRDKQSCDNRVAKARSNVRAVEDRIHNKSVDINNCSTSITSTKAKLQEARISLNYSQQKLENYNTEKEENRKIVEKYVGKLSRRETRKTTHITEIANLKSELIKLQLKSKEYTIKVPQLQQSIQETTNECKALDKDYQATGRMLNNLTEFDTHVIKAINLSKDIATHRKEEMEELSGLEILSKNDVQLFCGSLRELYDMYMQLWEKK